MQLSIIHIEDGTYHEAFDLSNETWPRLVRDSNELVQALVMLAASLAYGYLGERDRAADLVRKSRDIVARVGAELEAIPPELARLVTEATED
jgi:hypothetical protein